MDFLRNTTLSEWVLLAAIIAAMICGVYASRERGRVRYIWMALAVLVLLVNFIAQLAFLISR